MGVQVDGCEYSLTPVAQKAEVVVYKFDSSQEGNIRQHQVLRKIEREAAKLSFEHVADGAISEVVSLNQPKRSCWNEPAGYPRCSPIESVAIISATGRYDDFTGGTAGAAETMVKRCQRAI